MARKTKRSPISSSLSSLLKKHRDDETTYGAPMIDLPPGINRGIARLVEAKIGKYSKGQNEGEDFVYLAGVVVEPHEVTTVRRVWDKKKVQPLEPETIEVEGQRTGQTLPLCETTTQGGKVTTADENVERMLNELRKLGGDTSDLESKEDLESLLEDLKDAKPYFKFSTSAGTPSAQYPTERVWENWFGSKGLEDYEPEDDEDVEDNTEEDDEETETESEDVEEDEVEGTDDEEEDEDTEEAEDLGEAADAGDEDAQHKLTEEAEALELDPEEYETWAELEAAIDEAQGSEDEEDEEEDTDEDEEEDDEGGDEDEEEEAPEKSEVYLYKPPRARKAIECEVTAVFPGKETCNLKDLDTGKTFKSVPWSKLEE